MKPRTLIPPAMLACLTMSIHVQAQTSADAPPAVPPASTSAAESSPPSPPPVADALPSPVGTSAQATESPAPVKKEREIQLTAPPMAAQWMNTPAPVWWGSEFERPRLPVKNWYGWQTLTAVAAADLVTIVSYLSGSGDLAAFGIGSGVATHVLAGPIVHMAHGRTARGFGVFLMNMSFGSVGLLSSLLAPSEVRPAMAVMGYLAGPALDIALLSTEVIKPPRTARSTHSPLSGATFVVAPMIDSTRRGIQLVGQF